MLNILAGSCCPATAEQPGLLLEVDRVWLVFSLLASVFARFHPWEEVWFYLCQGIKDLIIVTKGAAPPFIKDCIQDHLEFNQTMWDQNFSQNGTALLFHEALSLIWCCTSTILPTLWPWQCGSWDAQYVDHEMHNMWIMRCTIVWWWL